MENKKLESCEKEYCLEDKNENSIILTDDLNS